MAPSAEASDRLATNRDMPSMSGSRLRRRKWIRDIRFLAEQPNINVARWGQKVLGMPLTDSCVKPRAPWPRGTPRTGSDPQRNPPTTLLIGARS